MRKLTLSLAVLAALLPLRGYPLGLGEIELDSALNQDLDASIKIVSSSVQDLDSLIVKLASREAFSRVGLDRPFVLQQLKFKVVNKNGQLYVKVFTKSPVQEPYLSFLVEIDWPKGHLLREYTLLLDPPVYNSGSSSGSGSSRPFGEPADVQAQPQSAFDQQQGGGAQTSAIPAPSGRGSDTRYQGTPQSTYQGGTSGVSEYRVQKNDTLWRIAERMRPDSGVSVEQMMLALLRNNPEAFIRDNINGIKRGYILRAPSRENITSLDRQRAVSLAREHTALWREYSQGAVSDSPASSMPADAGEGNSAADQPREVDGRLSIVGAGESSEHPGSNQDGNAEFERLKQDLAMAREELESANLEKQNLRTRLAELEQQVQSAIQMDDEGLAQLQGDLQGAPGDSAPDEVVEEVVEPEEVLVEDIVSEQGAEPEEDVVEDVVPDDIVDEAEIEDISAEPVEEDVFVDETDKDEIAEDAPVEAQSLPLESVTEVEPPVFAQKKSEGFVENLMNDPKLLGMIGGGLAFIFLLIALLLKRMRGSKPDDTEWTAETDAQETFSLGGIEDTADDPTRIKPVQDMESTAEMMADPMAGLGLEDTHIEELDDESNLEGSVFGLDEELEDEEDEEEVDEVLSEAGVYISYGIFQQAEELLSGAIDKDPERDDYRLKLLEVYYTSKNASAFEQLAKEVHGRKGDDKEYWDRVIAMGMEVCPGNNLFSGTDTMLSDFDAQALLPEQHEPADLDLEAGTTQAVEDELDLEGDLESINESLSNEGGQTDTAEELEFDLGELDDELGGSGEELLDSDSSGLDSDSSDLDIDDDFSLDFDASDLGFEEPEEEVGDAGITLDADLDLGEIDETGTEDIGITADLGDESIDLDMGEPGLYEAEPDTAKVDLSDSGAGDTSLDDSLGIDLSADDDDFDISELAEDIDEVSTKLDLARAYIDMGDSEGARSILEEVKAEGSDEQQKEAQALLQKAS